MIEASRHLPRQLDMRHLVLADRHQPGLVDQDVRRLQQGIAEETVSGQIPLLQFLLLILVTGHPFQPAERRDHGEQQMQFGMLRDL